MKRFLSLALALIFMISAVAFCNAATPTVSVTADKTSVTTGDEVTVSVKLGANSGLAGVGVTVKFDISEFSYVSGSAKTNGFFKYENDLVVNGGTVKYDGVQEKVVSSAGTIFSFKLKALKNGGKITASVHEAVNDNDQDVAASVSVSNLTLKCAHKNMSWSVTKPATCTAKGQEKGECTCGHIATRDIPMKDHTPTSFKVEKEPTCTEKGLQKAKCTVCQKEFTEEIAPKEHKLGEWQIVKEATETEKGVKTAVCSLCGEVKEQEIAKITTTEASTEEPTQDASSDNHNEAPLTTEEPADSSTTENNGEHIDTEKPNSTAKIVVKSVLATLGVEAVLGGIIFAVYRHRKEKEE